MGVINGRFFKESLKKTSGWFSWGISEGFSKKLLKDYVEDCMEEALKGEIFFSTSEAAQ